MAGSVPADHHAKSEVLALIDKVSDLIGNDAYADAAREIAAFVNGRPGLRYFVEEALPSRVSDHVLKKTGAHVAFTTYTLRNPNWATELAQACTDPEAFERLVKGLEAAISTGKKAAA
ncbi:hypothetical protein [Azorhizobium]|uniref:Uncharacterized protein n=1 Tax=Azorhizobium caulinodans (strain ATCC 43989 / DSM 5975 / JCM 20966 / LMG 6465 / NBRC 14845 / NCIMB 13405 / ORS 571) TaxID=438753 RepID=A8IE09_AZOC5|nr:hypothetical protein [Azorhizobium]TDT93473.1 hypothetical protein DFO45_2850 [Azorhizobium sp. AG788]BAF89019.1 unknown protein [Azorhizobium caulinodans ORS 571]